METSRGPLRVVGTFLNPSSEPLILMDIAQAQRLFGLPGTIGPRRPHRHGRCLVPVPLGRWLPYSVQSATPRHPERHASSLPPEPPGPFPPGPLCGRFPGLQHGDVRRGEPQKGRGDSDEPRGQAPGDHLRLSRRDSAPGSSGRSSGRNSGLSSQPLSHRTRGGNHQQSLFLPPARSSGLVRMDSAHQCFSGMRCFASGRIFPFGRTGARRSGAGTPGTNSQPRG